MEEGICLLLYKYKKKSPIWKKVHFKRRLAVPYGGSFGRATSHVVGQDTSPAHVRAAYSGNLQKPVKFVSVGLSVGL